MGVALRAGAVTFPAAFGAVGGFAAFRAGARFTAFATFVVAFFVGATRRRAAAAGFTPARFRGAAVCFAGAFLAAAFFFGAAFLAAAFFGDAFAAALRREPDEVDTVFLRAVAAFFAGPFGVDERRAVRLAMMSCPRRILDVLR